MKVEAVPLDELREAVEGCHACALCEGRTNTVFGDGNPNAQVMIIGEAPGKNEDKQGVPFVGSAGKYLNELLGYAGLQREDVFIANVLKCRPPSNRNPKADEIEACSPFLRAQVQTINPKLIITLGNFATQFILRTDAGITGLRGTPQRRGRFTVMPVFHPAAAIYDRSKRPVLQADFEAIGAMVRDRMASEHENTNPED